MKGKEKVTLESFDPDEYAESLREQGYRDDVIPELVKKKKDSFQKDENNNFEYIMKLEEIGMDNEHIIVAGFASSGSLDYDDESINQESLRVAWDQYMKNPVLRYMHGKDSRHPDAIGRIIPEHTTRSGKTFKTEFIDGKPFIVAKLSNAPDVEDIRVKVKEGVLKGFSIGGRADRVKNFSHKLGKDIDHLFVKRLSEISIVDLPSNKEGIFEVIKGCVGNNCSYNINKIDNDENHKHDGAGIDVPDYDLNKQEDINMTENIEMEMSELKEFVKSTVSEMITEQETLEKIETGEVAVKEVQNLRTRIAELEAKITAMAAQLKASPQPEMKDETTETEDSVEKTEDTTEKTETVEDDRMAKLEAKLAEIEASPLYKAEQTETEKTETVEPVSHLKSVINAHYGVD